MADAPPFKCNILHTKPSPEQLPPLPTSIVPKCDWKFSPEATARGVYCEHGSEATGPKSADDIWTSTHRLPAVYTCREPTLRGMLAGPFRTVPGQWTSIGLKHDLLHPGDRITHYVGDAVHATTGTPLKYPPLHLHHIHVAKLRYTHGAPHDSDHIAHYYPHWFETHGDYASTDAGYMTSLPDGYCDVFETNVDQSDSEVRVEAQLNDVRWQADAAMSRDTRTDAPASLLDRNASAPLPARARDAAAAAARHHSPPYEWYLRIVFSLADRPCRTAHKLLVGQPLDRSALADHLLRYDVGAVPSLRWWAVRIPFSGRLLPPAWLHSHRARYSGLLFVEGNHTIALAGDAGLCAERGGQLATCKSDATAALTTLRSMLLHAAGERLLCADDPAVPSFDRLPLNADGSGGYHDRQGAIWCRPGASVSAGAAYTVFAFSTAHYLRHVDPFPQHTLLFLRYAPLPPPPLGTPSSHIEVHPPSYSRWDVGGDVIHRVRDLRGWVGGPLVMT